MKYSVLLPTHNRLDLLAQAIETVRRQDFDDWEVIVSDNFSSEDVEGEVRGLNDPRIRCFRTQSLVPVTENWNNALDKSSGEYVIMLGDDDGLLPGYFSGLDKLLREQGEPDLVYTGALLYAYPGVLPNAAQGWLRSYKNRPIYEGRSEPFTLTKDKALWFVQQSCDFRVLFDYNMQFSLVSRRLIEKMRRKGAFYQTSYPDYYASNAMFLEAERIVVDPHPRVTIGISPKSFGFYYQNDKEGLGDVMLNNKVGENFPERLRATVLPGSSMNTFWLQAMDAVVANYGAEFGLAVNSGRYREVQIFSVFDKLVAKTERAEELFAELAARLRPLEYLKYGVGYRLWLGLRSEAARRRVVTRRIKVLGTHPGCEMPCLPGEYRTMLDVFASAKE